MPTRTAARMAARSVHEQHSPRPGLRSRNLSAEAVRRATLRASRRPCEGPSTPPNRMYMDRMYYERSGHPTAVNEQSSDHPSRGDATGSAACHCHGSQRSTRERDLHGSHSYFVPQGSAACLASLFVEQGRKSVVLARCAPILYSASRAVGTCGVLCHMRYICDSGCAGRRAPAARATRV